MKRFLSLSVLCVLVITLSRCASKVPTATATKSDAPADKVAEIKKHFNEEQLEEGKTIWQGACGKCHKLFPPESRDIEKWENVLPRMAKRSKLDDTAAAKVRAYLLVHARNGQ